MAEVVFQNLEEMLPELEELERQGVFARDELRIIIKRRTDFEYKLQKRVVTKQDILNYLEYELKLDLLQKKRSKRLKLKPFSAAALAVTKRIHVLFRKALLKFGNDLKLWMQYIDFCKKTESIRALGIAFGKLIQKHASNSDVWLMAAKYEFEDAHNIDNARSLLQRALRNNKHSERLWHEYFRLELLHVDKIKMRRKILGVGGIDLKEADENEPVEMDQFLSNKTALIVFRNAIKAINDNVEFRLGFINICDKFEDTDELDDNIYQSLLDDFQENEHTHKAVSKRTIARLKKSNQIIKDEDWQKAEEEVQEYFKNLLEKINTTKLWETYLNVNAELFQDSTSPQQAQRRMQVVTNTLESAEENNCVTESMYIFWCDLLTDMDAAEEALACLSKALELYKQNALLWKKYLLLKSQHTDSWSSLKNDFKTCFTALDEVNLTIWQMYVDAALCFDVSETVLVFEEAMQSNKLVKNHLVNQYLEWIYKTKGVKHARKFYKGMAKDIIGLDFIRKCINIEEEQDKLNIDLIRSLHEKCIDAYGDANIDVWIDYITFEKQHCSDDLERVGALYTKAKRTLPGQLNSQFLTKYTLIQNNT